MLPNQVANRNTPPPFHWWNSKESRDQRPCRKPRLYRKFDGKFFGYTDCDPASTYIGSALATPSKASDNADRPPDSVAIKSLPAVTPSPRNAPGISIPKRQLPIN